jgi:18S rRNA (adenine1779-N6/adenine1780-N6)-dimethyltransferase
MAKDKFKKRNDASSSGPYARPAAKARAANNIFKMNTDIGQHILVNPLVGKSIVEKADLKQSDVSGPLFGFALEK